MALIGKRRKLCELAAYLIVRPEKTGRPRREIRLPARWNAGDGAYQLVFFSGCVCLRDKKLAASLSSEEIGEGNFDDYRIETNYSVQRAVVRNDNDDTVSCNCLILIMKGVQQGKTVDIAEGLVVTRPSKIAGPGGHAKGGVFERE